MNIVSDPFYAALFALLQGSSSFVTSSRRLRHWSDVSPAELPALFVADGPQTPTQVKGMPPKWTLDAKAYIYVPVQALAAPGPLLNEYLDALDKALAPTPYQVTQTLGGLVSHCWISNTVETDEGTLGDLAVAIVPISMLVA